MPTMTGHAEWAEEVLAEDPTADVSEDAYVAFIITYEGIAA